MEAIKKVCESFENKHRKALIVMSTGTAKTRTAISLLDVVLGKGWVQNILFLADRTELVKQAKKNFVKLLPDVSCCNLLDSKDSPEDSRIIFSTYQAMINAIDSMKNKYRKELIQEFLDAINELNEESFIVKLKRSMLINIVILIIGLVFQV